MKRIACLYFMILLSFTAQTQTPLTISDILENALSSIVTVSVEKTENTKQLLGFRGNESKTAYEKIIDLSNSKGSGSGFIIDKNGKKYIITNAHVIENASEISGSLFIFTINRTKYEAKVIGGDSFYDIAVLEFVKTPGPEVKALAFANQSPRIGEKVFAIGNPLGEYPYSVSDGIISAKNRVRDGLTGKFGFLQTTATMIWGNSGGPLINEKGQVVGINSQIAFADLGGQSIWQPQINFALEGVISKRIVNNIVENNGRVKRAYMGIEVNQVYNYNPYSYTTTDGWELIDSLPILAGTIPGSPAEKVLKDKVGYKIVKVNGTDVRNVEEVLGELELVNPNNIVKITLGSGNQVMTYDIPTEELTTEKSEEIAKQALQKNGNNIKPSSSDNKVYISFSDYDNFYNPGNLNYKRTELRTRGEEINFGTWQIIAAGYEYSEKNKSMWRVKTLSDLGAAIRLTASLGFIDLYITPKEVDNEEIQVKRISLGGDNERSWKIMLWY